MKDSLQDSSRRAASRLDPVPEPQEDEPKAEIDVLKTHQVFTPDLECASMLSMIERL